jgi:hypothetical protein
MKGLSMLKAILYPFAAALVLLAPLHLTAAEQAPKAAETKPAPSSADSGDDAQPATNQGDTTKES